jgi:hypothetical protein
MNEQYFIGTATNKATMSVYGVAIGGGAVGALCACHTFKDYRGRRAYRLVAFQSVPAQELAEAVKSLRRELAEVATAKTERISEARGERAMGPGEPSTPAGNTREWRERVAQREAQEDQAAKARRAELDKIGRGFVAKSDGDVNLSELKALLDAGRIIAADRETRQPLAWLRQAFETGGAVGPLGVALARAIEAADSANKSGLYN